MALSAALGSAAGAVFPIEPIATLIDRTSTPHTSHVSHTLQHEHLFEKPEVELPAVPTPTMQPSTKGQRAAYNQMVGYIAHSPYSRDSLLNMLKPNDQFSEADAVWAIDHSGIDWNAEALAYAQQLIGSAASSQSGLQKELAYLGFTDEQATYAVEISKLIGTSRHYVVLGATTIMTSSKIKKTWSVSSSLMDLHANKQKRLRQKYLASKALHR